MARLAASDKSGIFRMKATLRKAGLAIGPLLSGTEYGGDNARV